MLNYRELNFSNNSHYTQKNENEIFIFLKENHQFSLLYTFLLRYYLHREGFQSIFKDVLGEQKTQWVSQESRTLNIKETRVCTRACVRMCPSTCVHASQQQSGEFGWAAVELLHLTLTNVTPFREIKHMNVSEI